MAHSCDREVKDKVAFASHRLSFSPVCPVIVALGNEVPGGLIAVLQ